MDSVNFWGFAWVSLQRIGGTHPVSVKTILNQSLYDNTAVHTPRIVKCQELPQRLTFSYGLFHDLFGACGLPLLEFPWSLRKFVNLSGSHPGKLHYFSDIVKLHELHGRAGALPKGN